MSSFTPRLLYSREKGHQFPLQRELAGDQSRFRRFGDVKILLSLPEIETRYPDRPALVRGRHVVEKAMSVITHSASVGEEKSDLLRKGEVKGV